MRAGVDKHIAGAGGSVYEENSPAQGSNVDLSICFRYWFD